MHLIAGVVLIKLKTCYKAKLQPYSLVTVRSRATVSILCQGARFSCLPWWRAAGEAEESLSVPSSDNLGSPFEFNSKTSNKKHAPSMSMTCCTRAYENTSRGEGAQSISYGINCIKTPGPCIRF